MNAVTGTLVLLKENTRWKDNIYTREEYNEIIRKSNHFSYYKINVLHENMLNLNNWWLKYLQISTKAFNKIDCFL